MTAEPLILKAASALEKAAFVANEVMTYTWEKKL